MSIKRIAVIGLGTLGGALCKNISEMESIDELIIIDYDVVESKNINNSIYKASQIGERKAWSSSMCVRCTPSLINSKGVSSKA